jgi:large subunit ribosomal protein L20
MPRSTKSLQAKRKHKKILKSTKGHYGARSRLFKTAKQSSIKSLQYSFRDRKAKKRSFRALWISRISAAARDLGTNYSVLINNLSKNNVQINRKMLSDISIHDPKTFKKIVETFSTK